MEKVQEKQVMLGDELTTQWSITNADGFVIWATFDRKVADKKKEILIKAMNTIEG